jgi:hypothetical protein
MIISWHTRLYSALLHLYPRSFRDEFGAEMVDIFSQAVHETRAAGALELGRLCFNEFLGLPVSIITAHLNPNNHTNVSPQALSLPAPEQSWKELLLALAVFLLPAVMLLINQTPSLVKSPGSLSIDLSDALLFLAVMISVGWLGGFPLRTQPYVGIVFVMGAYLYLFQWVVGLVTPSLISNFSAGPWDHSTYLLLQVVSTGMLWLMLFCLTLLVVALLAVFNRFQPFFKRVQHDWTLVSFILYGESVFALLMLLKTYRYDASYAIACLFFLAAGAWFFLHSATRWQRLLALLSGLTLAMGLAALEGWLVPSQVGWPAWRALRPVETGRLLLTWVWIVIALLLPGILLRRPISPGQTYPPVPPVESV